jgi:hypothetical protein
MHHHRIQASLVPLDSNLPQHPSENSKGRDRAQWPALASQSLYIRGAYPFEPAMEFKEIAAELGISVNQAQADFYRGMIKLGLGARSVVLEDLWLDFEDVRSSSAKRRIPTRFARTIAAITMDVPPHRMTEPTSEAATR